MANNRMQLVCGECGGWYTFGPTVEKPEDGGESRLTDWLAAHVHGYEGAMFGPCYFRLVYEVEGE